MGSWEDIHEEAYPASFYPPKLLSHGFSDESGTPLPVTDVSVANLPLVNPSNSAPPSSVHLLPAMGISNGYFSTHSFTRVNTISNFPAAPILPGTSHLLPGVECREKRKPQNRPYQYQEPKKKVCIPRFSCDDCDAKYAQRQGLNRHRQKKHERGEPSLCIHCDFKCSRPYEYRAHLEKRHPDVDANMILGKAAGSRRRTAYFARHQSQQLCSALPVTRESRRSPIQLEEALIAALTALIPNFHPTWAV